MKLPQFTIRDLLWFMVMVGIQGAWMVDRRNLTNEHYRRENLDREDCAESHRKQQVKIEKLQQDNQILKSRESERETQEKIRKIQSGELPMPP